MVNIYDESTKCVSESNTRDMNSHQDKLNAGGRGGGGGKEGVERTFVSARVKRGESEMERIRVSVINGK